MVQGEGGERREVESLGRLDAFLVRRFLLVAVLVAAMEALLQPLALGTLLPLALGRLVPSGLADVPETLHGLGILTFGMALLVLPLAVGAVLFARMVEHRVAQAQEERDRERERLYARRNLLVTDMAHDLRTPVMSILSLSQALGDGLVDDAADQMRYLASIRTKAERLGRLTDALFDFTRLESDGFRLKPKPCDLPQLVLREAAAAYTDAEAAGMTLEVDVSERPLEVLADDVQLGRVVANLMANAVRHCPAGTTIRVGLVRRAGVAEVVVGDTGLPMEGDVDRLFVPFSRGDEARCGEGSGLGLYIVRRIVELHGFAIRLEQPYGSLTKAFVLTCPVWD